MLENKYNIKVEVMRNKKEQVKKVRVLNKVVRLTSAGIELEADPRHVGLVLLQVPLGIHPVKHFYI